MTVVRRLLCLVVLTVLAAGSALASASNIYITQNGSPTGNCTTNVQTPAFFNNSSNWGSGSGQIGPGTTVLLCGTLTSATNSSGLQILGSGTNGNPITIQFDSNAVLQSQQFAGLSSGGGIYMNGVSYITIDGGSNGIIQNTGTGSATKTCPNGSACAIQASSYGVFAGNSSNIEIRNLTIRDIYLWGCCGSDTSSAFDSEDIGVSGGSNILIHNNTLNDAHMGVYVYFDSNSLSNVQVYSNTIEHHGWAANLSNGTSSTTSAQNISFYNNYVTNWNDWNGGGGSSFHTDGVIAYNVPSSGSTFVPAIYDNLFTGDLDGGTGAATGYIWCNDASGGGANTIGCSVFNNVFDMNGVTSSFTPIWLHASGPFHFYNNTVLGNGVSGMPAVIPNGPSTFENNIFANFYQFFDNLYGPLSSYVTSNNNVFYNCTGSASSCFSGNDGNWSFSQWQSNGHDANSITSNPNLVSGAYFLAAASPAVSIGANLTNLQISPLDSGAPQSFGTSSVCGSGCVPRATSGAWSAGALQYGTSLAPPTGLVASVQ
jgi:hypothetical protein